MKLRLFVAGVMLGMRKDCQVLIHVDVEQALAGQIPKFGIVTHSSISRRN